MQYLFQLGHQPEISAAELEAVFSKSLKIIKNYAILETAEEIDAEKLINQLGGTVKIAVCHSDPPAGGEESLSLLNKLTNYLITIFPTNKIEFSLNDPKLAINVKKELKNFGRSARYIELKNTATILHNKLVEKKSDLTIVNNQIFYTVAIQPFEEMAERDYGRPGADDKSGMLPPKLARMMINLSQTKTENTLLDPFCGSGTILTEAASMGYTNLIGSDISDKAISDTKKNLEWLIANYRHLSPIAYRLHVADSQKLSAIIKPGSINAIITEPYLGQPLHGNETEKYLNKQITELKNLYLNAFQEFYKVLKPSGNVVFIIPSFVIPIRQLAERNPFSKNKALNWMKINLSEEIKKIGFEIQPFNNSTIQQLTYHRPGQHLGREIWRFKKIPI